MNILPQGTEEAKASYWHPEGELLSCDLCPRRCQIPLSGEGYCGTRANHGGKMVALNYGKVCVSAFDPIEKKPIFHFKPGAKLLSLGTFGCNLDCGNCQNSTLARMKADQAPYVLTSPEQAVEDALEKGAKGIAFTFNEPTVWMEFIMDTAARARDKGLFTLLNTNGYIEPWAADDLFDMVEVANIDVKGMSDAFYKQNCGGHLGPVLESCIAARMAGVHLELTYLLIPGKNDSAQDVRRFASFVVRELGEDVPIHLFRFQPAYKMMQVPPESMDRLLQAYEVAKEEGVQYVYLAGVVGDPHQNTMCPKCGAMLVKRSSKEPVESTYVLEEKVSRFCPTYSDVQVLLKKGGCPDCGAAVPIVL